MALRPDDFDTSALRFQCHLPHRLHGGVAEAHKEAISWAVDMGLVGVGGRMHMHLERGRFAWLAGRTYPTVAYEDLLLATEWVTWLFVRDDICDGANRLVTEPERQIVLAGTPYREVLAGAKPAEGDALSVALADILTRIEARGGAGWRRRFARDVVDHFDSNLWEEQNRRAGVTPGVEIYKRMRRYAGAVYTCLSLAGAVGDVDPDAEFLDHAVVRELATLANDHVCWVNDCFGVAKDVAEGDCNNFVLALADEDDLDPDEALRWVARACDRVLEAFEQLADGCPSFGEEQDAMLEVYLDGMRSWMRGNMDWYGDTHRYSDSVERLSSAVRQKAVEMARSKAKQPA